MVQAGPLAVAPVLWPFVGLPDFKPPFPLIGKVGEKAACVPEDDEGIGASLL